MLIFFLKYVYALRNLCSFIFFFFPSILFSQSLLTLDAIETILEVSSSSSSEIDKMQDAIGTWIKGLDYFRMDGTTSAEYRKSFIDMFNDPSNDRYLFFKSIYDFLYTCRTTL